MGNGNARSGNRGPKNASNWQMEAIAKIPPHNKEVEEAVLGAILITKDAIDRVVDQLQPNSFYVQTHQDIFDAILTLYKTNSPIDLVTVVEQLRKKDLLESVGGPYALAKLTNNIVSSANIEAHAKILTQKWIKRQMSAFGGALWQKGFDAAEDDLEILEFAEKELFAITTSINKKNYSRLDDGYFEMVKRIEHLRRQEHHLVGIPSGYTELDRVTHGFRRGDLIILAARPSMGKTALALNLADNASVHSIKPTPAAIFSLEMSIDQLSERMLSRITQIPMELIVTGKMNDAEMDRFLKAQKEVARRNIYVDDTARSLFEIKGRARRMVQKDNVGLIIIDYLQLMEGGSEGNREQEISTISRGLKSLAKELQVPIVALSQLSRKVEERKEGDRRPRLSDLRESGAIEQDADMVMFLYRPEYYDINANEMGDSTKGYTELDIRKHRNGQLATILLQANLSTQDFKAYEQGEKPSQVSPQAWRPVQQGNEEHRLF